MKKILSIVLAVAMVLSMSVVATAEYQTNVTYEGAGLTESGDTNKPNAGQGEEVGGDVIGNNEGYYYITVPASVTVGGSSATVKVEGKWSKSKTVTVTCANEVDLSNGNGDIVKATVSFDGISLVGDDSGAKVNASETISIAFSGADADHTAPAFGTWTGTLTFNVQ